MTGAYAAALTQALHWGRSRHPRAPPELHGAFSRSVARLVEGPNLYEAGDARGPSMRERAVRHEVGQGPVPFDTAVELVEEIAYGELTIRHAQHLKEGCVDDSPEDLITALKLLNCNTLASG